MTLHLEVVEMAPCSTAGTCHGYLRLSDFDTYPVSLQRSAESDARTQVVALALSPRRIGTLACWPTTELRALACHDDQFDVDLVGLVVDLVVLLEVKILRQLVVVAMHHSVENWRANCFGDVMEKVGMLYSGPMDYVLTWVSQGWSMMWLWMEPAMT